MAQNKSEFWSERLTHLEDLAAWISCGFSVLDNFLEITCCKRQSAPLQGCTSICSRIQWNVIVKFTGLYLGQNADRGD